VWVCVCVCVCVCERERETAYMREKWPVKIRHPQTLRPPVGRRVRGCLIFVRDFSQKSPIISRSFAENDLQLKASYASWHPSSASLSCAPPIQVHDIHIHVNIHTFIQTYTWRTYIHIHTDRHIHTCAAVKRSAVSRHIRLRIKSCASSDTITWSGKSNTPNCTFLITSRSLVQIGQLHRGKKKISKVSSPLYYRLFFVELPFFFGKKSLKNDFAPALWVCLDCRAAFFLAGGGKSQKWVRASITWV